MSTLNKLFLCFFCSVFLTSGALATVFPPDSIKVTTSSVQEPLPTDGDSVYSKDIDVSNSSNGDFSGSVTDYFDSLKSVNANTTSDNPKIIKIWFYRSILTHSIGFGCDDLTKSFSNIKIKALGSGEEVRYTKDLSSDSTKRNSYLVEMPLLAANGFQIEFHTTDEVNLSNLIIFKTRDVHATLSAAKDNDEIVDITATDSGNLRVANAEDGLSIAKGDVSGSSLVHKFGNAPDFDAADGFVTIWDGADDADIDQMNYVYSTTAAIDSISSSSGSDTFDLEIQGLDANYELVVQTITLTGQTRKALDTNLIRVFRLKNVGTADNVGHVYCYENTTLSSGVPVDSTKVRAILQPGNNQTLMAVYTVPAGKTAYVRSWYVATAGANKSSNYIMRLEVRPFGQVFQLKHLSSISDAGSSSEQHAYVDPPKYTEKSDIEMQISMTASGATAGSVSGGFDLVLVDN